jgi:hypothetical protein
MHALGNITLYFRIHSYFINWCLQKIWIRTPVFNLAHIFLLVKMSILQK